MRFNSPHKTVPGVLTSSLNPERLIVMRRPHSHCHQVADNPKIYQLICKTQ